MNLDFRQEALDFCRANGCPPACIIQKAMERGAELALQQTHQLIKSETDLRRKLNVTGLTSHGENNGQLAG